MAQYNICAVLCCCQICTVLAWIPSQVGSCGICGGHCGAGSGFLQGNVYSPAGSVLPPSHLTSCTPTIKKNLHGLSLRANYTDRATTACRGSDFQLFADRGVPCGQRNGSIRPYSRFSRQEPLLFLPSSSSVVLTRLSGPRSRPTTFFFLVVQGIEPGPSDL
jgi:hypothetical protein